MAALSSSAPAFAANAVEGDRVLVGVNYFAGWWEELPNKWHGKGWTESEPDWRSQYPGRVPLLGSYNDQATMDREIVAAASHGVDFFSILWYFPSPNSREQAQAKWLNRGLENYLASPNAGRMRFMIEYCNAPTFRATNDEEWSACVKTWVVAMKHPSYLRVDGRLVFKVHNADLFLKTNNGDLERSRHYLDALRNAVRGAGLGEMLIGGGIMSRSQLKPSFAVAKLFDFTATYMSIPPVPQGETEHPFATLAEEARKARAFHADDPIPWVPYVAAGWNPHPWSDSKSQGNYLRFFAFPTRAEWLEELRAVKEDFQKYPRLGLPRANGSRQPIFTIYAWNEFGEGGIVAPTRGEKTMKLEAIQGVFAPCPATIPSGSGSSAQEPHQ